MKDETGKGKASNEGLWHGLTGEARKSLENKDYASRPFAERLVEPGVMAGELVQTASDPKQVHEHWIPGVEIFLRKVFRQSHRGTFAECARQTEGPLHRIGLWPRQWSTSRIYAGSAKGIHVHPPHIPAGRKPAEWFRSMYAGNHPDFRARPYMQEQWDVWFFLQGTVEVILIDLREGLPRRTMRFFADGEDKPGPHNVGVVVPAGVGHGLRVEGSQDAILVYGTTTTFRPEFEGRIASDVETKPLPESWQKFLGGK